MVILSWRGLSRDELVFVRFIKWELKAKKMNRQRELKKERRQAGIEQAS